MTVIVGVVSYWMVHDFPDRATFLSEDDRRRVIRRLKVDRQASAHHETFEMKYFWAAVKDWKTYAFAIVYMGADGSLYAFSLFLPTIIKGLGKYNVGPERSRRNSFILNHCSIVGHGELTHCSSLRCRGDFYHSCWLVCRSHRTKRALQYRSIHSWNSWILHVAWI
jgi:hypothetical protein